MPRATGGKAPLTGLAEGPGGTVAQAVLPAHINPVPAFAAGEGNASMPRASNLLRPVSRDGIVLDADEMSDAPRRRAVFREVARDIADGVNPGQSFARAMEKAFQAGLAIGRSRPDLDVDKPRTDGHRRIEPIDLGPRARDLLSTLSLFSRGGWTGEPGRSKPRPFLLRRMQGLLGKPEWRYVDGGTAWQNETWGNTTPMTLVKEGMLAHPEGDEDYLTLTTRGMQFVIHGATSTATPATPFWTFPKLRETAPASGMRR